MAAQLNYGHSKFVIEFNQCDCQWISENGVSGSESVHGHGKSIGAGRGAVSVPNRPRSVQCISFFDISTVAKLIDLDKKSLPFPHLVAALGGRRLQERNTAVYFNQEEDADGTHRRSDREADLAAKLADSVEYSLFSRDKHEPYQHLHSEHRASPNSDPAPLFISSISRNPSGLIRF
jgi:hypothetical protein